jgi:hypothetical protein
MRAEPVTPLNNPLMDAKEVADALAVPHAARALRVARGITGPA